MVSRRGQVVHSSTYGLRDVDAGLPFEADTVVRMFSMTKPITSVAAMMLYEEGAFSLKEPISRFIPEFADTPVYTGGSYLKPVVEPQTEPIRIWHLLSHTSGLTYGFHNTHPVDAIYRQAGFEWGDPGGHGPRGVLPGVGEVAARVPAGQRMELRRVDRCAGARRRGRLRPAAR